jgi:hypothetical protein
MEERGNKTIMCSVLFLDIVEYSKKSVAEQISLKDRFNSYLSSAIRDVPMTDRIILDTGDGAAINFLGDVEDALKAALNLRESLLNEEPDLSHPLLVRIGINLGPVRLVRDINGLPNIVGDGINVAQRVMGFADAAQILVSRSYYDAVSRLSPQYAGMFHYQGSRTDKHVREHEVYAIGYPDDKTMNRGTIKPILPEQAGSTLAGTMQRTKMDWHSAVTILDDLIEHLITLFRQAGSRQRALYVIVVVVPLLLLIVLLTNLPQHGEVPAMPTGMREQTVKATQPSLAVLPVATVQPVAVAPVSSVPADSDVKVKIAMPTNFPNETKQIINENIESKNVKEIIKDNLKDQPQDNLEDKPKLKLKSKHSENQPKIIKNDDVENNSTVASSGDSESAYITVTCMEGTEVFVDGIRKGRVGSLPLTVVVPPGKHTVIVSHTIRGIFTQSVELNMGMTAHIKPSLCN